MGGKPSITSGRVSRLAGSVPGRQVRAGHGVPGTQACQELRKKKCHKWWFCLALVLLDRAGLLPANLACSASKGLIQGVLGVQKA